jgi:hypothetical protein
VACSATGVSTGAVIRVTFSEAMSAASINSGSFTVNGQSVGIGGNLQVQGGALLIMTNPADVVTVSGNALFTGGNELGNMSAGALSIGGNLAQASGTTGDTFHPSGTHLTLLIGNNPTVTFQTPGDVPGTGASNETGQAA